MPSEFESKIPHYTFPSTLDEQRQALEENPLLSKMKSARREYQDHFRPRYHYVNPDGTLNDPNGLCFWQGRWHLFYQGYPPEDPRQHWGHAVSDDLVHWEDLPYAIYPDPEDRCFSGATLVENDRVIAMYHGTKVGNMIATSSDPLLLNWEKIVDRPVIPIPAPDEQQPYTVFDPCIWRDGDAYYALSGGMIKDGPAGKLFAADYLFRSKDLLEWEYLHPFVEDDRYTRVGDDGACPYFWPINDRHMLIFFSHTSGGQCLVGDYDTDQQKFHVIHGEKFNFGASGPSGVHAPSATPNPNGDGSVIAIFNMNPGKPTKGWDQIMSLPRELTYSETEGQIFSRPVPTLTSLRDTCVELGGFDIQANSQTVFDQFSGDSYETEMVIQVADTQVVELDVLRSPDAQEYSRISIFNERGYWDRNHQRQKRGTVVVLDTSHSSVATDVRCRPPERVEVLTKEDNELSLRVYVDRSIVEVFINDQKCVAARVYPERRDSTGIAIGTRGGPLRVQNCVFWDLKSIYE